MKSIYFILVALLAEGISHGQNPCNSLNKSQASEEDRAALSRISTAVGFDPQTIFLYVSHDSAVKDRGGAMSLTCATGIGFERWIVYDPDLIKSDAPRDFVFAHETAHHVNFQSLSGLPWSKEDELQADFNGAQYLLRLGWTKAKLDHALDLLNLPQGSQAGYPSLEERKAKVEEAIELLQMRPAAPTGLEGSLVGSVPYEESLKKLLNFTYEGPILFQSVRTNKYVCAIGTPDPKIPSIMNFALFDNCPLDPRASFELRKSHDGSSDYWITQDPNPCPDYAWSCLYAWEPGERQLQFWNEDFSSYGFPGKQELFDLEASESSGLFRIKVHTGGFVFVDPSTAKLESGASREQATEFKVLFDSN
jgi:hypothetical protein